MTAVNDRNLWPNLPKSVIDCGQWQKKVSLTGCILYMVINNWLLDLQQFCYCNSEASSFAPFIFASTFGMSPFQSLAKFSRGQTGTTWLIGYNFHFHTHIPKTTAPSWPGSNKDEYRPKAQRVRMYQVSWSEWYCSSSSQLIVCRTAVSGPILDRSPTLISLLIPFNIFQFFTSWDYECLGELIKFLWLFQWPWALEKLIWVKLSNPAGPFFSLKLMYKLVVHWRERRVRC